MKYRGAIKLSAPVAIVILIIAAIALYWSVSKSGFFVQHGNVPTGPPGMSGKNGGSGSPGGTGVPTGPPGMAGKSGTH